MPPSFQKDSDRLKDFTKQLRSFSIFKKSRQVFEFRHETWFTDEVYEILKKYRYGLCFADSPKKIGQDVITSDFLYLRFHGGETLYGSHYSDRELKEWAKFARKFKKQKDIFAFFNNDAQGFAIKNALRFKELLDK